MRPRRGPVARGAADEAAAPATAAGNDGAGTLCSEDSEDFFLIAGGGADSPARSPPADARGVLHIDLCVRRGEPWVSRLWYEGRPNTGGAHRYAVAVHNGGFDSAETAASGAVADDSDDDSPPRLAVGSSQKKSRARLVSSSSDEHSEAPSARRRVSLGDDASDGDVAPRLGSPVVRRSQRLDDRQKRRQSSPLAERLIKRQRNGSGERRALDDTSDDSDGSLEAANGRERRARRRRARRESDDDSGSDDLSDFLVDDDDAEEDEVKEEEEEVESASGDVVTREGGGDASPPPPPNPYLMSKEELDECKRPAAEQLRAVTSGRRLDRFGVFRLYMKSLLRRACRELSDRGGRRRQAAPPAVLPDEKEERRAACKVREDMIRSMKNTLNSAAWRADFKDALDKYQEYRPMRVPYDGRMCQACHRSERRATYEVTLSRPTAVAGRSNSDDDDDSSANREPSPERKLVFYVGRRCANRSQGYHELQHYEQAALDACRKRVRAAADQDRGPVTPELCLDGKDGDEWIQLEYQLFQSQLSAAEQYMDKDVKADDDG